MFNAVPSTTSQRKARFAFMATLYREQVGARIRARREELGLTQRQLADRIGVESQTVSRWERGANLGKETNLEAVASGLEWTVEELMAGIEAPRRRSSPPDLDEMLGGQPGWAIRLERKVDELLTLVRDGATSRGEGGAGPALAELADEGEEQRQPGDDEAQSA
jgi:transcriptional regulator with XRE-family HTH domain